MIFWLKFEDKPESKKKKEETKILTKKEKQFNNKNGDINAIQLLISAPLRFD